MTIICKKIIISEISSFFIIEYSLLWDSHGHSLVSNIDLHSLEVLEVTDSRASAAAGYHQTPIANEDQNDKVKIDWSQKSSANCISEVSYGLSDDSTIHAVESARSQVSGSIKIGLEDSGESRNIGEYGLVVVVIRSDIGK